MPPKPLAVRRVDNNTYDVHSMTRPDVWHRVEMDAPGFPNGQCACEDFTIRIESAIRRGEEPARETCTHIRAVQADLHHARELCELAGVPFSLAIIPTHADL